jgi:hypothetical protein
MRNFQPQLAQEILLFCWNGDLLTVAASPLSKGLEGHIYTCGVICHNRSADVQNEKLVRKAGVP